MTRDDISNLILSILISILMMTGGGSLLYSSKEDITVIIGGLCIAVGMALFILAITIIFPENKKGK